MRILLLILLLVTINSSAQRELIALNDNWSFRMSQAPGDKIGKRVDLPHTWNAQDALSGDIYYNRGIGNYEKTLLVPESWKGKRVFIKFEGANSVANVFVNGKHIGEHRGGYTSFIFELTNHINYGEENKIWVRVNNSQQLDVMPLVGDFNMYGGIYRDVYLMLTNDICISPLDYASSGIYLKQQNVSEKEASVDAKVLISKLSTNNENVEVQVRVINNGNTIIEENSSVDFFRETKEASVVVPLKIKNPRLWNGTQDPFMYDVEVSLLVNGKVVDLVKQPLGLRYFKVDKEKGFFLNGKHLSLQGVNLHQDRPEIGNAIHKIHHEEDLSLMTEMGANAVRLSHYPHAPYFYDLLDKSGFVVWSEIPFVGPGGYADKGFVNQESFKENGRQQLKEMIRQNYNHPSVIFWGLFNELKEIGDNPNDYVSELNQLAKEEDPTRITTAATNINGDLNKITDLIAWNTYYGWYGGEPKDMGAWLDKTHSQNPDYKIGISEYGAGASIYQQQDTLSQPVANSWWHPENWQTYYFMENWKAISERPYVWGSFIWIMFDFGAAHRTEGDRTGINDKGIVTFDRKVKKDAFYFYKSNWNTSEKMVYIADRRAIERTQALTDIMVFSNTSEVELLLNGKSLGKQKPDKYATLIWKDVKLSPGINLIEAKSKEGKIIITDSCQWSL